MSPRHFTDSAKVKEISINRALKEMYNLEFNEINPDSEGSSNEDDRFVNMLQENIQRVNGYYQLQLPFKESTCMPNNRAQEDKRLKSV